MKKKPASKSAFFNPRFLIGLAVCSIGLLLALLAFAAPFGVFPAPSGSAPTGSQSENSVTLDLFQVGAAEHTAWTADLAYPRASEEQMAPSGVAQTPVMAATRSSFLATWDIVNGAIGYRLDVSTSSSFNSYVSGYQDLDAGNVTFRIVSGLSAGTTYYYRVH